MAWLQSYWESDLRPPLAYLISSLLLPTSQNASSPCSLAVSKDVYFLTGLTLLTPRSLSECNDLSFLCHSHPTSGLGFFFRFSVPPCHTKNSLYIYIHFLISPLGSLKDVKLFWNAKRWYFCKWSKTQGFWMETQENIHRVFLWGGDRKVGL